MTQNIFHGIKTTINTTGASDITSVATAVIGMVVTAPDADATKFPLDTPILIDDVRAALSYSGTQGTFSKALSAIADQCQPTVVAVRVGVDAAHQDALVTGQGVGGYTGMQALLTAPQRLGVKPRIIGAPGLASQTATGALAIAAKSLRGMAYAHIPEPDVATASTYAAGFGARELMLLWPNSSLGGADIEARALGLRAAIDQNMGWHKTLSNVEIAGMSGLDIPISFGLDGTNSDAALLNNANITTIINRGGYRFWGNRTTSSEPKFAFESAVRTSQVLQDSIDDACFTYADKPLTIGLIKDIMATINAYFRKLVAKGLIIGATCWYDSTQNTDTTMTNGVLALSYDFTPCAPLEGLQFTQTITSTYYVDFTSLLKAA
jgi:phage tail sheath protein FI